MLFNSDFLLKIIQIKQHIYISEVLFGLSLTDTLKLWQEVTGTHFVSMDLIEGLAGFLKITFTQSMHHMCDMLILYRKRFMSKVNNNR